MTVTLDNLNHIIEQVKAKPTLGPGEFLQVKATMTTNQDNGIVSYAEGLLRYKPGALLPGGVGHELGLFEGTLDYYFNDRRLDLPKKPGDASALQQPFSSLKTDKLGFSIDLAAASTPTRTFKLTLLSWGGTSITIPYTSASIIMHGLGPAIGNNNPSWAVYLVSFQNFQDINIR